ncbi:MAG: hypothetical protein DRP86_01695 [Candidatus Neomarinimicrobiota bacterium]|nr:hypothetical protein [Candidatus Neomarinimicrobiota bacterium]RKY51318.1 MAG: hypothetical protein DRP86_01695 [Candidatus Neomarinimicrobiota bacterium]
MIRMLLLFLAGLMLAGNARSEISLSGDTWIRPRFDLITNKDGDGKINSRTGDAYLQFRARLNLNADINNGYFAKIQLSHNSLAFWSKMGSGSGLPSASSDGSAQSPSVDFTRLYVGKKGDFGFDLGRIPQGGNTIWDIHYYPTRVVDIPFLIFNNNAYTGFRVHKTLGDGLARAYFSVDENRTNLEVYLDGDSTITNRDGITIGADYALNLGALEIVPQVLWSTKKSNYNPLTAGAVVSGKVSGYSVWGEAAVTIEEFYDGWIGRIGVRGKTGPGVFRGFFDYGQVTDSGDNTTDHLYSWLEYKITVHNSDAGSVKIRPTWRRQWKGSPDDTKYTRNKIECFIEYAFK